MKISAALVAVLLSGALQGCGGSVPDKTRDAAADTLSQGARDSALARSRLPNAGAVGRAQNAAQASQDRAAQIDSLAAAAHTSHQEP